MGAPTAKPAKAAVAPPAALHKNADAPSKAMPGKAQADMAKASQRAGDASNRTAAELEGAEAMAADSDGTPSQCLLVSWALV